jgi:hypothetical protein
MRFTTAVRLSVLLAVFAVPADALGASGLRTSSVTGRIVVPQGRPSTLGLHCPPHAVALNAAITSKGAGAVVRGSNPGRDAGAWSFRVSAAGSGSRAVSAVLRCVSLQPPEGSHARVDVKTLRRANIVLAPGATATARAGCGSRWTATGYALRGGRRGDVRLAAAVPGAHGWRFTLENTGSATARATVTARCVRSTVTARSPSGGTAALTFGVHRQSFSTVFPPGPGRIDATACRGGRFGLAAGGSLDPASSIELVIASPIRQREGRWRFRGGSGGDRFTGHMLCLSQGSRFR